MTKIVDVYYRYENTIGSVNQFYKVVEVLRFCFVCFFLTSYLCDSPHSYRSEMGIIGRGSRRIELRFSK